MKKINFKPAIFVFITALLFSCESDLQLESNNFLITNEVNSVITAFDKLESEKTSSKLKIESIGGEKLKESRLSETEIEKIQKDVEKQIKINLITMSKRARVNAQLFNGYDVGVPSNVGSCPSWSETIRFKMDNEDNNNATSFTYNGGLPYYNPWVTDGNGNTTLTYCRVDGSNFWGGIGGPNSPFKYGLLRLGWNNPIGLPTYNLTIDNEDNNNQNFPTTVDLSPGTMNTNTYLVYYVLNGNGSGLSNFPNYGFSYAIHGGSSNYYVTDDEDSNNTSYTSNISLADGCVRTIGLTQFNTRFNFAKIY